MPDWKAAATLMDNYASDQDADVILWNGPIGRPYDHQFIDLCRKRKVKRANVLVILTTPGGDAHAAYRIARCLQRNWKHVTLFAPGWCKSAGTLLAIGANELVIGDFGELGPIDVQRPKEDELWESSSGLTEDAAIHSLETSATKIFEHFVFFIKHISGGQVSLSLAAHVSADLTASLLEPIFAQIDPAKIGENSRAMAIARDYGLRLGVYSKNLKDDESMERLVSSYSSHGFCIDREEAMALFENVISPKELDERLEQLCDLLEDFCYYVQEEDESPLMRFLNQEAIPSVSSSNVKEDVDDPTRTQADRPENPDRVGVDLVANPESPNGPPAPIPSSNVASLREIRGTAAAED